MKPVKTSTVYRADLSTIFPGGLPAIMPVLKTSKRQPHVIRKRKSKTADNSEPTPSKE